MSIDLDNHLTLPNYFIKKLENYNNQFIKFDFFDNLMEIPSFKCLIEELNIFCKGNTITGYHFTRAFPTDISTNGLIVRSGTQIRSDFKSRFKATFSTDEWSDIEANWQNYFDESMSKCRDDRIFFNFTKDALNTGGAAPLLGNFGGEQVYFCIDELPTVKTKIANLGEPMIVKCELNPSDLHVYFEHPWGRIAASSYHCAVNKNAHQVDQDGFQTVPVLPDRVELISI
jgi:hypothetical protein